jgi:hypothetical protein
MWMPPQQWPRTTKRRLRPAEISACKASAAFLNVSATPSVRCCSADQVAGPLTVSAMAIAAVLVVNGVWAVWEEGFNSDATLRLEVGIVACLIAVLLILRLAL